jgi:hypothetical protein
VEHEVDDRPRPRHGGAAAEADEAALADRRVAQPLGAEPVEQPGGGAEVAPTLADPLTEDEDRWVALHRGRQRLQRRLHEADFTPRSRRRDGGGRRPGRLREDVARRGRRVGPRGLLREVVRLLHLRLDLRLQGVQLSRLDAGGVEQPLLQPPDRAARLPLLHLVARAVGEVAHALGVGAGAVRQAFEQRRPAAGAGAAHRLARRLVDRGDVVAVHPDARQAVGGAARCHAGIAGRVAERHLGGVLVVFTDKKDRQFPDGGQVQPLVKGAVVDRPVAEEGHGHAVGLPQFEAVAGPGRLEDGRPDDAAGPHQADPRGEQVHAAAAAVRAAGLPAVQLGDELPRRHALGQRVTVAAVRAEDDVVGPQMGADAGRDRLLADVGVAGAVNQAALVGARQPLFTAADPRHRAVQRQQLVLAQRRRRFGRHGRRALRKAPVVAGGRRQVNPLAQLEFPL